MEHIMFVEVKAMQSPTRPNDQSQLTVELETYLGELLFDHLQAVHEKDEIIAQAVHDLRGPITNLKLYIYLLERAEPDQRAKHIAILKECASELSHMTEDLMDQVRAKTRRVEPVVTKPVH
jgi:signal transduction histidine kinase